MEAVLSVLARNKIGKLHMDHTSFRIDSRISGGSLSNITSASRYAEMCSISTMDCLSNVLHGSLFVGTSVNQDTAPD